MDKIDIKGLARELNISASTVSRALRDSHEISQATIKRVKDLAEKLNYQPHPYASSLRQSKTKTIGIIVPEVANSLFANVFNGIESEAQNNNYHALIYLTHESYEKEASVLKHLQGGRVDGVIMSVAAETKDFKHIQNLIDADIQVVFFDRVCEEISASKVTINDFESGYKATEHLIKQGCKRIAHLTSSLHLSTTKKRKEGYIKACADYNLPVSDALVLECNEDDKTEQQLTALLTGKNKPDGLFAATEKLSLIPYAICPQLGIQIPRDLKFISFSNMQVAGLLTPSLTAIKQPAFELGKQTAKELFRQLEKKKKIIPVSNIVLPAELIIRDSTKK